MSRRTVEEWLRDQRAAREVGYSVVAGVDEAGRGPLAGPVVAACVVLQEGWMPVGLDDSKALEPAARQTVFQRLVSSPALISVGFASPAEIDALNIRRATHLAMNRAVTACPVRVEYALVDGLPVPTLSVPHRALVGGDGRCAAIAAASVVAKVIRDEIMVALDRRHPGYDFATNKGYPTPCHLRALRRLGPSPVHRKSFAPVRACLAGHAALPFDALEPILNGEDGEAVACLYLERCGHRILARRFRSGHAEVDIVSLDGSTLVFTEVKTSRRRAADAPSVRLSDQQRRRIAAAAAHFLATSAPEHTDCRFDVVEVILSKPAPSIEHYRGAFVAEADAGW